MRRSAFGRRNALIPSGISRAGIALFVVVAVVLGMRAFAPGTLTSVLAPVAYLGSGLSSTVSGVGAVVTGPSALQEEVHASRAYASQLEEQNRVLAARISDLERLLGTRQSVENAVRAGVILRPPQSPYDTLVIDQGSDAGVGVGGQVQGPGGVPVGDVASVTTQSARVVLYSAPERVTEGWVGEARTPLTLTGTGAGSFEAAAPREAVIREGDAVFVPGPGALPLGIVSRIDEDPANPTVLVHVRPITNPFTLTWVMALPPVLLP